MWKKPLVVVALVAVACGGPDIQVTSEAPQGIQFFPQIVDFDGDAGLGVSMTADADGNPHLAYLVFEEEAEGGEAPAPDPSAPELPAVKHAHLVDGAWTRSVVADGLGIGPEDETAIAVDGDGVHHVAWTEETDLFYSSNADGEFSRPEKITSEPGRLAGLSIFSDGGETLVAFAEEAADPEGPGALIRVASSSGRDWEVETAAETEVQELPGTGVGVIRAEALVAYGFGGETLVARSDGGPWVSETVDPAGGLGVNMAMDVDGNPHLAYYTLGGEVKHAHDLGGGWEISNVDDAGGLPSSGAAAIAVGEDGVHHISWQTQEGIGYSTNEEGGFSTEDVPMSEGGTLPRVAAGAEGVAYVAWYDPEDTELQLGTRSEDEPFLAFPPPEEGPGGGATVAPAQCEPEGPGLAIEAPPGAVTDGFATDCLAVVAGEEFTLDFNNADPNQLHNVSIYTDSSAATRLFEGEVITGPDSITYEPDPIDEAGNMYFQCDIHPTTMTGTFVVAEG